MKRIVHVCNDANFYLSHFSAISAKLVSLKAEVIVVAGSNGMEVEERFRTLGIAYIDFPFDRSGTGLLKEVLTLIRLFHLIRKLKPDCVHLFTIKPCIYGGMVSRVLRVPLVIATVTGLGYTFIESSLLGKLRKFFLVILYRIAFNPERSRLVFENKDDLQLFASLGIGDPTHYERVWGAGVDLQVFSPGKKKDQKEELLVMLPARMLRDKGVVEFCEAAKKVTKRLSNVRFALVGGVDVANRASLSEVELTELVNQCGLEWWGHQSNMPMVLRGADIVCLPSYREGMPKVLLEAMACGKVVVTTDVPGCREVIESGKEGLIVKVKDVDELVDALVKLTESAELRDSMSVAARERAERLFDVNKIVAKYLSLYPVGSHE